MTIILLRIPGICRPQFKCNYLGNQQLFVIFLFYFFNPYEIVNILKKKMIAIPTLFRKLQNVKNLVRPLFKKRLFRKSFKNQHVKQSQTLVKYASDCFYHIFSSLWETLIWKISALVIG